MGRGDGEYVVNLYNPLAHLGICISAEKYDDVDSCEELVD
jgi:hypothetical protein